VEVTGAGALWQDEPEAPPFEIPVEPFYSQLKEWALSTIISAAAFAAIVAGTVSTAKTVLWAFIPETVEDAIKNMEIGRLAIYPIFILGVTFFGSLFAVVGEFNYDPWAGSPLTGLAQSSETLRNVMSAALLTFFASVAHEGRNSLVNWAKGELNM
jgi:hypothetical protein